MGLKKHIRGIINLYDDLLATSLIKNSSNECTFMPHALGRIVIDSAGMYDGDRVTFLYVINRFPRFMSVNFRQIIRAECTEGVTVNFITTFKRHRIEWESSKMRLKLRVLRRIDEEHNEKNIDVYNMNSNIKDMEKQEWLKSSLEYLSVADKKRRRGIFEVSMLMLISGKRGSAYDGVTKRIEEYLKDIGVDFTRVLYNVPEVLQYFSPFTTKKPLQNVFNPPKIVLTDELVARLSTYTQGILGNRGAYFGTDVESKFPVMKVVKRTPEAAECILITAETGGGKSFVVKCLLLQLLLDYNCTVMDIEGIEYLPIAYYLANDLKVKIINMGEGDGKYFDPVEIPELTGIEKIDKEFKNMAVNFTLTYLRLLLGGLIKDNPRVDALLNDAVSITYRNAKVTSDPNTWRNSKGLSLFSVYETFKNRRNDIRNEKLRDANDLCVEVLKKYFEKDGTCREMFNSRVGIEDIKDADLLICSFGMAGKSESSVDPLRMNMMQLSAAQISHQRSIFSFRQGKSNLKVWEEVNRWGKFPNSDKTLGTAITGGRKLGDVNVVLTNAIGDLLKDDKFSIFANCTSYMIGAINDANVRQQLCDRLTIPHMLQDLTKLSTDRRDMDDFAEDKSTGVVGAQESKYSHAFLCGLDKNKYGIVKMNILPEIAKSELFRTGVEIPSIQDTQSDKDAMLEAERLKSEGIPQQDLHVVDAPRASIKL